MEQQSLLIGLAEREAVSSTMLQSCSQRTGKRSMIIWDGSLRGA